MEFWTISEFWFMTVKAMKLLKESPKFIVTAASSYSGWSLRPAAALPAARTYSTSLCILANTEDLTWLAPPPPRLHPLSPQFCPAHSRNTPCLSLPFDLLALGGADRRARFESVTNQHIKPRHSQGTCSLSLRPNRKQLHHCVVK